MRWIVILAIAVLAINASFAQGTSYKGDWCSFEAPDGCYVFSEDDTTIVLQKVISADLLMQLQAGRLQDVDTSHENLQLWLGLYMDLLASGLQDSGVLGTCTGEDSRTMSSTQGWTAIDVRYYRYPHADILSYSFGKSDDIVVLTLIWAGSDVPSMDTDYLTEPITDAYTSFRYYG